VTEAAASQQASPGMEQQAALLQQGIAQHGEKLVRTLVLAACDTAPRQLMRALGGVLYQLLQPALTGDAGRQWLLASLQAADLPGGCEACMSRSRGWSRYPAAVATSPHRRTVRVTWVVRHTGCMLASFRSQC
jgi:hypothetical protein